MNQRGSTLIEAVTAMATLCALVSGGFSISYLTFARVWLERSAYEAVVCLATSASVEDCERRLTDSTGTALPLGRVSKLELRRNPRSAEVALRFSLLGQEVIRLRDKRALPLIVAGPT